MINKIKDLDRIAKEFKVHIHCYRQFTSSYASGAQSLATSGDCSSDSSKLVYDKGEFEKVTRDVWSWYWRYSIPKQTQATIAKSF